MCTGLCSFVWNKALQPNIYNVTSLLWNTAIIYALLSLEISWDNWCFIVVYILRYSSFDCYFMMHIQEFIQTLSEPMVRKLCVRSLQRGKGSMDYIQSSYNGRWPAGWWYWYNSLYSSSFSHSWTTTFGWIRSRTWSFSWYKFAFVQVWHLSSKATGNRKQMLWEKGDVSLIILDYKNCVWTRMYSN